MAAVTGIVRDASTIFPKKCEDPAAPALPRSVLLWSFGVLGEGFAACEWGEDHTPFLVLWNQQFALLVAALTPLGAQFQRISPLS